jgi:hypothetical protein
MTDYSQMANLLQLVAMDPPKKGINPLNQTEGGFFKPGGGAMGAVRGGPGAKMEAAARQAKSFAEEVGLQKGIDFAARRFGVDPAELLRFMTGK